MLLVIKNGLTEHLESETYYPTRKQWMDFISIDYLGLSKIVMDHGIRGYESYIMTNELIDIQAESRSISMGAEGDSFYEYLIKAFVQSGKRDEQAKEMYIKTSIGAKKWLLK